MSYDVIVQYLCRYLVLYIGRAAVTYSKEQIVKHFTIIGLI